MFDKKQTDEKNNEPLILVVRVSLDIKTLAIGTAVLWFGQTSFNLAFCSNFNFLFLIAGYFRAERYKIFHLQQYQPVWCNGQAGSLSLEYTCIPLFSALFNLKSNKEMSFSLPLIYCFNTSVVQQHDLFYIMSALFHFRFFWC